MADLMKFQKEVVPINTGITFGEYKGHKVATITAENGRQFTFGQAKAKLITQYVDSIKAFAQEGDSNE